MDAEALPRGRYWSKPSRMRYRRATILTRSATGASNEATKSSHRPSISNKSNFTFDGQPQLTLSDASTHLSSAHAGHRLCLPTNEPVLLHQRMLALKGPATIFSQPAAGLFRLPLTDGFLQQGFNVGLLLVSTELGHFTLTRYDDGGCLRLSVSSASKSQINESPEGQFLNQRGLTMNFAILILSLFSRRRQACLEKPPWCHC